MSDTMGELNTHPKILFCKSLPNCALIQPNVLKMN